MKAIRQPVTLLVLVLMMTSLSGCVTAPEPEKVSPKIVTTGIPLSQGLGKIGLNVAAIDITLQTPTSEAIQKKQFWNHFARGNTAGLDLYWKIVSPFAILLGGYCTGSGTGCSSGTATIKVLGFMAAASGGFAVGATTGIFNGIIETWKGNYSTSATELEEMLLYTVGKSNDELKTAIMAASRRLLFEYMGQQGVARAIAELEKTALVGVSPPQMDQGNELQPSDSRRWLENSDSLLDARIREVTLHDDMEWFNSKLQLRVRVETNLYRTDDATLIDKRDYTCVSIPRTFQYWSLDSYSKVREELVECNQLLGQQIANDLLGASLRNDPGRKAQ